MKCRIISYLGTICLANRYFPSLSNSLAYRFASFLRLFTFVFRTPPVFSTTYTKVIRAEYVLNPC